MAFSKQLQDSIKTVQNKLKSYGKTKSYNPRPAWQDNADPYFSPIAIDPERFDTLFPYRFLIWDVKNNLPYMQVSGGEESVTTKISSSQGERGINYIISQQGFTTGWEFTLPISPQQLTITDQYAITNTPTMRGVVETHNGVKYKIINIQGTTGVWANRDIQGDVIPSSGPTTSILSTAFGSTISAFNNVLQRADKLAEAFKGTNKSKILRPSSLSLYETGYYKALQFSQFLEQYANLKKDPSKKHLRLVLDIQKENQAFIVTPQNFSLTKSQQKPNEYQFNLQLRAWKRIDLQNKSFTYKPPASINTPNILQRVNNTIRETRKLISSSTNLIYAVRSDAQGPLNTFRQVALTVKDLGGFAFTVADLPSNIIQDYSSSIKESMLIIKNSFSRPSYQQSSTNPINQTVFSNSIKEGLSDNQYKSLSADASINLSLDPSNQPFQDPTQNFEIFDNININQLNLTPIQSIIVNDTIQSDILSTQAQLNDAKNTILTLALDISNSFGASHPKFAQTYNRPTPKTRTTPMSEEENELLLSLYETIQALDSLTSTNLFDESNTLSPLQYVGQMASEVGIDIENSPSKYLVPVPFNLTLEQISARYLNTPDRWIEIATINALRSPYIDEEGFTYNFLSNGSNNQFTIQSNNNLYIGQKITLSSNIIPPFITKINNIEKINESYLITVDHNTSTLTTLHNAKMTAYLPGTVNSQDSIYIPSNAPSDNTNITQMPEFKEDVLTRMSRIDWLLDDNNDLAINAQGEIRLANGLNNLVQALKIKIFTKKNSLIRHPEFGLGISHGVSISDITSGEIYKELQSLVLADGRFQGIERLDIIIEGGTIAVDMSVTLANNSGILPITFKI